MRGLKNSKLSIIQNHTQSYFVSPWHTSKGAGRNQFVPGLLFVTEKS